MYHAIIILFFSGHSLTCASIALNNLKNQSF